MTIKEKLFEQRYKRLKQALFDYLSRKISHQVFVDKLYDIDEGTREELKILQKKMPGKKKLNDGNSPNKTLIKSKI